MTSKKVIYIFDDKIKQISYHYDFQNQRDMVIEECAELIQAINKCKRGIPGSFDNFVGELADVLVMLLQMRDYIGKETIDSIIEKKLNRQLERIEKEIRDEE